jgi:hypothetical protein
MPGLAKKMSAGLIHLVSGFWSFPFPIIGKAPGLSAS